MNPVERRLMTFRERWDLFRDDASKRLLVWQLPDNALRFAHCFFETQQHELPYASGDLFIVFDTAFENSIQYSRELKETLAGRYEASRDDLRKEGIEPDWQFAHSDFPDAPEGFAQGLRSFASHHPDIGHIAVVLAPGTVAVVPAWIEWLQRALTEELSARVRYVLLDSLENPRLQALSGAGHPLISAEPVQMDAWETAQETFSQEAATGPAGVFRTLLASLCILVEKGSADQVMIKATDALAFARRQGWPDQEVVVRMLAAGSMLKARRFEEAVNHYGHARTAASKLAPTNPAVSNQLILQGWFGEAGAHYCAGDSIKAARCYDESVPVAQGIPNVLLWIEALRMSAYSYLQAGRDDLAMNRGLQILDVAQHLPADQRLASTLPIALLALLRLVEPARIDRLEAIRHQLDEDQARVLRATEQQAARFAGHPDPAALRNLEAQYAADLERLDQDARHRQKETAAGSGEQFRTIFRQADELLGRDWLLDSPALAAQGSKP